LNSSSTASTYATPFILHGLLRASERTPQYIFAGLSREAVTYSPYFSLRITKTIIFHPYVASSIVELIFTISGRLSGQNWFVTANFRADQCWAHLLQSSFRETFGTLPGPDDISSFINEFVIKNNAHNLDLLAGGLQPTRRRPTRLIPNGPQPHEHLRHALLEAHPFISSSTSKSTVLLGLEWCPDDPAALVKRRQEVARIVELLSRATKCENDRLL